MKKITELTTRILIYLSIFISTTVRLLHADDYVVEDIDFYRRNHRLQAPSIKAAETAGYLELHIAPANEEGVSINIFKILDTTRLKGLLIVNSLSPHHIKNIGHIGPNQNLEYSLTPDRCATKIVIEVASRYPTADTYLQGLIRVVGKQAKLEIISDTGVSINGAFFKNLEELDIQSSAFLFDEDHNLIPYSSNIRVSSEGIYAACPVFLYARDIVIDGIIDIPNHLHLSALDNFHFSENVTINQLGDLTAEAQWRSYHARRLKGSGDGNAQESNFVDADVAIGKMSLNYDIDIYEKVETPDSFWINAIINKKHTICIRYYNHPIGLIIYTWDEQSQDIVNEIANYLNQERF